MRTLEFSRCRAELHCNLNPFINSVYEPLESICGHLCHLWIKLSGILLRTLVEFSEKPRIFRCEFFEGFSDRTIGLR
jgi:hypothetical protein